MRGSLQKLIDGMCVLLLLSDLFICFFLASNHHQVLIKKKMPILNRFVCFIDSGNDREIIYIFSMNISIKTQKQQVLYELCVCVCAK